MQGCQHHGSVRKAAKIGKGECGEPGSGGGCRAGAMGAYGVARRQLGNGPL